MTMFNLFKNKQREEFDKDYYQFVDEFTQLVQQSKKELIPNDDEDFIEIVNRHVSKYNDLFRRIDDLELKIESNLKAQTAEQSAEKMQLLHQLDNAQTTLLDAINHLTQLKSAYLQGLEDGYKMNEKE
jgi:hypothetical protein